MGIAPMNFSQHTERDNGKGRGKKEREKERASGRASERERENRRERKGRESFTWIHDTYYYPPNLGRSYCARELSWSRYFSVLKNNVILLHF